MSFRYTCKKKTTPFIVASTMVMVMAVPGWIHSIHDVSLCHHGIFDVFDFKPLFPFSKSINLCLTLRRLDAEKRKIKYRIPIQCHAAATAVAIITMFDRHFLSTVFFSKEFPFNTHRKINVKARTLYQSDYSVSLLLLLLLWMTNFPSHLANICKVMLF